MMRNNMIEIWSAVLAERHTPLRTRLGLCRLPEAYVHLSIALWYGVTTG